MLETITDALSGMPPVYRQLLIMHRFDGLSYAEIASRMYLPEPDVRECIAQALAHCQKAIDATNE